MRSSILFTLCFVSVLVGQGTFTAADIATNADGAASVFAADMDCLLYTSDAADE